MSLYWLFLLCFIAYFIGNINFSVLISKIVFRKDIRKLASGNPGTMNMMRNFGFKWGLTILILDALKGAVPAFIGLMLFKGHFSNSHIAMFACGLAATIGHIFPIIYKFKGGKGVATTVGVFFVANPFISSAVFVGCAIYLAVFEYGAMASFLFITFMVVWQSLQSIHRTDISVCIMLFVFYFLSWYAHRANIFRLLTGKENTVSLFKKIKQKRLQAQEKKWLEGLKNQ